MRKKDFVKYWNENILCNMPSKTKLRAAKKRAQKERQAARLFMHSEHENIDVTMDQVKNLTEYLGDNQSGLGDTPVS